MYLKSLLRYIFVGLSALLCIHIEAQNSAVMSRLRSKYPMVQYHSEGGGWYFVRYQSGNDTYYGFVDKEGNLVADNATEYKQFKGYIKLYQLDPQKKARHDEWKRKMEQYNSDKAKYDAEYAKYQAEKDAYDARVENARRVAEQIWQQRRQEAYNNAVAAEKQRQAYQQANQQQASGWAGIVSGVLTGISNGVSLATVGNNAAIAVQFEPIFNRVKAELGLSNEPNKPSILYGSAPSKPVEPSEGFEWKTYTYIQPNPYSYIDYDAIQEVGTFADVMKDGRYGLVDASLNVIYPCNSSTKIKDGTYMGLTRVKVNGMTGLLNSYGNEVFKPIYSQIQPLGNNVMAQYNYMWGLYTKQGAPLTQHIYSDYQVIDNNCFIGKVESHWGLYASSGSQILPPKFDKIDVKTNYLYCTANGKYGLYTKKGRVILPPQFDNIKEDKGYILCENKSKWGVYSANAKEIYPCQFDNIKLETVNGKMMLYIQQKGMWGLLDFESGNEVLPTDYTHISVIKMSGTDFYKVQKNSKTGLYDMKGLLLIPCHYDNISTNAMGENYVFEAKTGEKLSVFTNRGLPILPLNKYTKYSYSKPFFYVWDGLKEGVVTEFGTELIACEYDEILYDGNMHCFTGRNGNMYQIIDAQGQKVGDAFAARPVRFHKDFILASDASRKYMAFDYQGHPVTKRSIKESGKVSDIIGRYQKKHPLFDQNKASLDQMQTAWNTLEQQVAQGKQQRHSFSYYAKIYVERIINDWQVKGEFEDTKEYTKRVNNETRAQKIYELTKAAQDEYIQQETALLPEDQLSISGPYDADNQVFKVKSQYAGKDMLVPVPRRDAEEFRNSFNLLKKKARFFVENDHLGVSEYAFQIPSSKQICVYSNKESHTYDVAKVNYEFADVTISTDNLNIGTSDVDVQIPETGVQNPNLYVFIFANESYQDAPRVEYAYNDGLTMKNYCLKTLGVPAENIHFRPNATLTQMRFEVNKIREIATNEVLGKDARIFVYYSGHGVPDEKGKSSYLLPVDGMTYDLENTAYKVSDLYAMLGELACENTVILDACFSGITRAGGSLTNTKAVVIANKGTPSGRTVVLSATDNNEVAHLYEEKAHSLFTYHLLKKMQESKGNINLGDLFKYAQKETIRSSVLMKKKQTPTSAVGRSATNWNIRKL